MAFNRRRPFASPQSEVGVAVTGLVVCLAQSSHYGLISFVQNPYQSANDSIYKSRTDSIFYTN
jgi:hypothetical protein